MNWKLALSLFAALALSACGFHPLYGEAGKGSAAESLASVYVEPIPDRVGYELRNDLVDLFQSPAEPAGLPYHLKIELKTEQKGFALQHNASITRYTYHLTAKYSLTDSGGKVIKKGEMHSLASYNVVQSPFATVVSGKDAEDRAAQDIANRLQVELGVYFHDHAEGHA